jgi:hypothetical protein
MNSMRLRFFCFALALSCVACLTAEVRRQAPDCDLVLFSFDTESLPWHENLKLTLEHPRKFPGNPVLKPGAFDSIDGYGALLYGTVLHIDGKFRMWYIAWPQPDSSFPFDTDGYRPIAYAESTDGKHWVKPNLGLVEFRGNKSNNIVSIEPAIEPYARPDDFVAVLYDVDDPDASRRYKMAYIVEDKPRVIHSTATAVSPDGIHWKLVNKEPFTRGHFENTSLIRYNGLYYLAGQAIPPWSGEQFDGSPAGRTMRVFFSADFQHWSAARAEGFSRPNYVTKPEGHGEEAHMGAGLWNRGNVILGIYGRWHGGSIVGKTSHLDGLTMDLGLLISNDAIHYREPIPDFTLMSAGGYGDWDQYSLLQANAFCNTETETYIWYTNWDASQPWPLPALPTRVANPTPNSVGLATLPRDRFGYVQKEILALPTRGTKAPLLPRYGEILSRSILLERPARVFVNVDDVSDANRLEINLVNDAEQPLAGYSAEINECSLKGQVRWKDGKSAPAGQPFRIRVRWPEGQGNPKLYAIYVERGNT